MIMSELIGKKRDGGRLTAEEIRFVINGYTCSAIPDYQMSAMLMAIYFAGMDRQETLDLTNAIIDSGDRMDLSTVSGIKADKHSSGGVGDKTSLVLCPMIAALGVKMAKMSGRGLGHTGGTIDKLESFLGFSCDLSRERFLKNVDEIGFAIAGQTDGLTPADKKLYALRDVTGTVASRPLIVSSIMSKKLAAGADIIVLDVKCGSGSFMKSEEDAFATAQEMVGIGQMAGRKTIAVISDMDEPLGNAVGNALEVKEAIAVLEGKMSGELLELCMTLGSSILVAARVAPSEESAAEMLMETISSGKALKKFAQFVCAQGGDERAVFDTTLLPAAPIVIETPAPASGYVSSIAANEIGSVCLHLGGGRKTKESLIDLSVGVVLHKKRGDYVQAGESLASVHSSDPLKAREAVDMLISCYKLSDETPLNVPFIKGVIR